MNRAAFALLAASALLSGTVQAFKYQPIDFEMESFDGRPLITSTLHNLSNLWVRFSNIGLVGTITSDLTMEWPGGSGSEYLWYGALWASAFGEVTPAMVPLPCVSRGDLMNGEFELRPSENHPMVKTINGTIAHEQTEWAQDDWAAVNPNPMGVMILEEGYSWRTPGYNDFYANHLRVVHKSQHGNPGVPLTGFCLSVLGDCDIATADPNDQFYGDDLVFYDGHAIWCNDPDASFDYIFDNGDKASESDEYTWQRNPDAFWADPEDDIYYHYNYPGSDGIVDADVNSDGVSDHFTVLFKVCGTDTIYRTEQNTGMLLFADGLPELFWKHTVGDTVYAVVPRNMSYMWDGDRPQSFTDDTGEPTCQPPCNGFIGWRFIDLWVVREDGTVERPVDVMGSPIPLSHSWWNLVNDARSNDTLGYEAVWGLNMDYSGRTSGPAYLAEWIGDPCTPHAFQPQNPGPFPVVQDNPLALGYLPFDYMFLISIGPVDLADGDTLHVVGGWVMGRGLEELRLNADVLLDAYYRDGGWGVPDVPPVPSLYYDGASGSVQLQWSDETEWYEPFGGYRLYRSVFNIRDWTLVGEFKRGEYAFTDSTVTRGFPYFYSLCVYDALTGIESSRTNYRQELDGTPVPVVPGWGADPLWKEHTRVVPNPYRISAPWEEEYQSKIAFTNLPPMCDIRIYTLAGAHVRTLEHRSYGGDCGVEYWDLTNESGRSISTGLYVYTIQTETDHCIGKFAVVR